MSRRRKDYETVEYKPPVKAKPKYNDSHMQFKPKTENQAKYVKKIEDNTVTFCTGPAGTGKSLVAIALAAKYYLDGKVSRIVIARPAVEASTRGLGYLPGDLNEKIQPYLMPAINHLKKLLGRDRYAQAVEREEIKFETLEYMRGSTYDYSFMILEEAQNCTVEQLVMFITRIGQDSIIVINGDVEQTDLSVSGKYTDLEIVINRVLNNALEGFAAVQLTDDDIVRNPIIKDFIKVMR
jgi:phosphate starvation-inducible PhoH-like protein